MSEISKDFYDEIVAANAAALQRYRKEDPEYKEKLQNNLKYINMYKNLVLSAIRNYDYRNDKFLSEKIENDYNNKTLLGTPKSLKTVLYDIEGNWDYNKVVITIVYDSDGNGHIKGFPTDSMRNMDYNFVQQELLDDYGIDVSSRTGAVNDFDIVYQIKFDASIIIQTKQEIKAAEEAAHLAQLHQK